MMKCYTKSLPIISTIREPSRFLQKEIRLLIRCGVSQGTNDSDYHSSGRCFLGKKVHLWFQVDPIFARILWTLLNESEDLCLKFTLWIFDRWKNEKELYGGNSNNLRCRNSSYFRLYHTKIHSSINQPCLKLYVNLQLLCHSAVGITSDIRWCKRLRPLLIECMVLHDIMSWLSTLGGAYSSLGELSIACSQKAGNISQHQLLVAMKLNNPALVAQCKVFFAMSMVQRGHLRTASKIIRQQYTLAKTGIIHDSKLVASCKAVWNKIRYIKQCKVKS